MDSFDSFESPFRRTDVVDEDSQIEVKMKCSASADYAQSGHEIPVISKEFQTFVSPKWTWIEGK